MKDWILASEAIAAMGITRQWLRALVRRGAIVARAGAKSRRGRPKVEILLESLPPEAQKKYFDTLQRQGETDTGAVMSLPMQDGAILPAPSDVSPAEIEASGPTSACSERGPATPAAHSPLITAGEKELEKVNRLAESFRGIETAKNPKAAKEALARREGFTYRTANNLYKKWRRGGTAALLRKIRKTAGVSAVADPFITRMIALTRVEFLKPYRPKKTHVHAIIVREFDLEGRVPWSYSTTCRICDAIPPDMIARFRIGEREYDDKFAFITRRSRPELPRDYLEFDHHLCDRMVLFPSGAMGRPWITASRDTRTNEILGVYFTREKIFGKAYPGSEAIGLCLRLSISKKDEHWPSYGVFNHMVADLGKDFRGEQVRAVCSDLNIKIVHTRGYHGKSKGGLEGWFGKMEDALRDLPGYVGRNSLENPARQALKPRPFDPSELMTLDEFEGKTVHWITRVYHHSPSRALNGLSPLETLKMHVERGFCAREVQNPRALDLLLHRRTKRTVTREGVHHFNRLFFAPELLNIIGRTVDLHWDPSNVGEIFAYDGNNFVCRLVNRELVERNASEQTLERERAYKRIPKQQLSARMQQWQEEAQHPDPLARAANAERREKLLAEERQKVAVGAQAPSVAVLVPKYERASRRLSVVKNQDDGARSVSTREERQKGRENDELKSLEELFPPEDSPEEPIARKCHGCGAEHSDDQRLEYCLNCFFNPDIQCKKCGGWYGCLWCGDCAEKHAHRSKVEVEENSAAGAAVLTHAAHLKAQHPDWSWLDRDKCDVCEHELRTLSSHKWCAYCDQLFCENCQRDHECKNIPAVSADDS